MKIPNKDTPRLRFISWSDPNVGNQVLHMLDNIDRKNVIRTVNLKNKGNEYCIARVKRSEMMWLKLMSSEIVIEKFCLPG